MQGLNPWTGAKLPETTVNTPIAPVSTQNDAKNPTKQSNTAPTETPTVGGIPEQNSFEIADGVRRAKAAEQLGYTSIEAMDHTGKTFQVQIENLRSPFKSSVDLSTPLNIDRYNRIYNGFKAGDKLPPIYVNPGNRGVSVFNINFTF